jgi:hypothetical protein
MPVSVAVYRVSSSLFHNAAVKVRADSWSLHALRQRHACADQRGFLPGFAMQSRTVRPY